MALIQDLAGNPLITQDSPMIGFQPVPVEVDLLNLDMYRFIIEVIRQEDQQGGGQFLQRYLKGPQEVWKATTAAILKLPTLWDISAAEDRFLPFMKHIVGWTPDLESVTSALDNLTLRRLIASSIPFWKRRGPEDAIEDILLLTTTARLRIVNWFDLRIIMNESFMDENWAPGDSIMVSEAGEREYNIRIVDDGSLNRQLVRDIARLTRPVGETVTINYLAFLDLFKTKDDKSQWADEPNPLGNPQGGISVVNNSEISLGPRPISQLWREDAYVSMPGSTEWANYVTTFRVRGQTWRCNVYHSSPGDFYEVALDSPTNSLQFRKAVGNSLFALASATLPTTPGIGTYPNPNLYNSVRILVSPEGATNRIIVWWDGIQIFSLTDSTHTQGSIGIAHGALAGDFVALGAVEIYLNPMEFDTIGINS